MEAWKQWVLHQPFYYTEHRETPLTLDLSDKDDKMYKFLDQTNKIRYEELLRNQAKLKLFPKDYLTVTDSKFKSVEAHRKPSFHPKRFYWKNHYEYLVYLSSLYFQPIDPSEIKYQMDSACKGIERYVCKVYVSLIIYWVVKYLQLSLGIYHKQGVFQMKSMLPIARYYPYLLTGFAIISISFQGRIVAEIIGTAIWNICQLFQYENNELIQCPKGEMSYNFLCFQPRDMFPSDDDSCMMKHRAPSISISCGNHSTELVFAGNIGIYYFNNTTPYTGIMEVLVMGVIVFSLLLSHYFKFFLRFALVTDVIFLIIMVICINTAFFEFTFNITNYLKLPSYCFFFWPDMEMIRMALVEAMRDFPLSMLITWAATARLQRSSFPGYDTIIVNIINKICGTIYYCFGLFAFIAIHSYIRLDPTLVFRKDSVTSLTPIIWTFLEAADLAPKVVMPIIFFFYICSVLNTFIFSMEAVNFNLMFINEKTLIYRNVVYVIQGMLVYYVGMYLIKMKYYNGPSQVTAALDAINLYSTFMFFVIVRVYTLERLSTDVDFMTGTRPNWLIALNFNVTPFLCIAALLYCLVGHCSKWFYLPFTILLILTFAYILYEGFKYGTGIALRLTPTFNYGPPNNILRRERKLFVENVPRL